MPIVHMVFCAVAPFWVLAGQNFLDSLTKARLLSSFSVFLECSSDTSFNEHDHDIPQFSKIPGWVAPRRGAGLAER